MVKFSKELEAQLIPEWKEAFLNYWQLKKQIKKIKLARQRKHEDEAQNSDVGFSIFDPLRAVVKKFSDKFQRSSAGLPEIIQVLYGVSFYSYMKMVSLFCNYIFQ